MIDATQRAAFVTASTEEKVAAVYALVAGTEYYGIKGDASNAAVKALWDDAVAAGLIASQIVLSADQINIAGKTIYTSSKTESISAADAAAAQSAAISAAATDATTKANNAKSEAISAAAADATSKRNDVAQKLGYADWAAMETAATQGKTIIDGGYLRTSLIEVEDLLAQNITIPNTGYIQTENYSENNAGYPSLGFKIDSQNSKISSFYLFSSVLRAASFYTPSFNGGEPIEIDTTQNDEFKINLDTSNHTSLCVIVSKTTLDIEAILIIFEYSQGALYQTYYTKYITLYKSNKINLSISTKQELPWGTVDKIKITPTSGSDTLYSVKYLSFENQALL